MNTGQMLLTIGGLMLMSTLIIRMNTAFGDSSIELKSNNFDLVGASMATSYLETVKTKGFDQSTITNAVYNLSSLTTSLGKESSEQRVSNTIAVNATNFNDIDDFNNDLLYVTVPSGSNSIPDPIFKIQCKVAYYNPATNNVTTSQQWHKKITVTVSGPEMSSNISLSTVYSYWKFR